MPKTASHPSGGESPEIPGYTILGPIGEGATSIVYRGMRGGQDVAVKVLRDQAGASSAAEAAGLLFRQEAAALARIDHVGVVKVLEAGDHEGTKFLVMELVEGDSLAVAIGRGPMPEEQVISLARTLAGGLAEVHRCGLLHRDIKPSNVLLTRKEQLAKIIDFGFVGRQDERAVAGQEAVVGTFLYGAPEQTGMLNRTVDARSDLYSLGCVLFECALGRPPFRANDVHELLRMHAAVPAPNVHKERPEIRPLLAEIVEKLLAKDPDDRYQSALALVWDLEHLTLIQETRNGGKEMPLGSRDGQMRLGLEIPLVGRTPEIATVRRAWTRAAAGSGAIVQVEGEGGSGKTRLIRELVQTARGDGKLVLAGKAQKLERTPFGPLREAVDDLVGRLRRQRGGEADEMRRKIVEAAGEMAPVVKRLSRSLESAIGKVEDLRPLEPDAEQERFYEAIARFFAGLATSFGGAVLHIDDVQWLDDGTAKILTKVAARIDTVPLLLATTARNDADSEATRDKFVKSMGGTDKVERIVLEPLDLEAIEELLQAHLGKKRFDKAIVERLASRSNGNPFAIGQYVRSMLDQGLLRPTADRWVVDLDKLNEVVVGADVVQLLLNRIALLGAEAQKVLTAGAVLGFTFEENVLIGTVGQGDLFVRRGLDEAARAGLVENEGERWAFVHDRVQEALLAKLDAAALKDLNQAAAESIEKIAGLEPPDDLLFALARHYAAGHADQHRKRVFETSMAAGINAQEHYSNEEAFQLLDRAINVSAEVPDLPAATLAKLRELTGLACMRTGRHDLALQLFQTNLAESRGEDSARLYYLISLTHSSAGRNEDAWREIQKALEQVGSRMPENRIAQVVYVLWFWVSTTLRIRTGFGYGKAKGESRKRREMLSLMYNAAFYTVYYMGDFLRVAVCSFLRLHNTHFLGTCPENAKALASHGLFVIVSTGLHQGRRNGASAVAVARQLGDKEALAYCETVYGMLLDYSGATVEGQTQVRKSLPDMLKYCIARDSGLYLGAAGITISHRGRARESIERIVECLPMMRRMGVKHYVSNALGSLYVSLTILGRDREALSYKAEQIRMAGEMPGIGFVQSFLYCHRIHALYEQEDFGREMEDAIEKFLSLKFDHPLNRVGYLVMAWVRLEQLMRTQGKRERAIAKSALVHALRVASYGPPLRCILNPVHRCHILTIRAALAREEGKLRKATRLLARAEDDATESDSPWGLWVVHRERGRVAAQQKDDYRAREQAQRALELALAEGWTHRANRIRYEFGLETEKLPSAEDPLNASVGPLSYAGRGSTFLSGRRSTYLGPRSTYIGRGSTYLGSQTLTGTTGTATVTKSDFSVARQFEALLEVTLAASTSLDPDVQCRSALDALIRTLGAERGFLFLDEGNGELKMTAGRDVEGHDQTPLKGYSSTIVKKTFTERKGIVVTGTDEGEAMGSASAVAFDLRSIITTPLLARDKLLGVIYVDSRLMKGLFTQEHLAILQAIGNQLAVALETSRSARLQVELEKERSALAKDIELTRVVQALCVPGEEVMRADRLAVAGRYFPSHRCGGDWWWQERTAPGTVSVLIGDVTGHGAGAAMVSAAVASCYRLLRRTSGTRPVAELLPELSTSVREVGNGDYLMTIASVTIDVAAGTLVWHNAGGPPAMVLRNATGKIDILSTPGTPLGATDFRLGKREAPFQEGDRLLLFTDGLMEAKPAGATTPLSMRRIADLLGRTRGQPLDQAVVDFREATRDASGEEIDDVTFVIVDREADGVRQSPS